MWYQRHFLNCIPLVEKKKRSVKCYKFENYTVILVVCGRLDCGQCRNPLLTFASEHQQTPHSSPAPECSSGDNEHVSLSVGPVTEVEFLNSLWLWKGETLEAWLYTCVSSFSPTQSLLISTDPPEKEPVLSSATQPCISSPRRLNCLPAQLLHLLSRPPRQWEQLLTQRLLLWFASFTGQYQQTTLHLHPPDQCV